MIRDDSSAFQDPSPVKRTKRSKDAAPPRLSNLESTVTEYSSDRRCKVIKLIAAVKQETPANNLRSANRKQSPALLPLLPFKALPAGAEEAKWPIHKIKTRPASSLTFDGDLAKHRYSSFCSLQDSKDDELIDAKTETAEAARESRPAPRYPENQLAVRQSEFKSDPFPGRGTIRRAWKTSCRTIRW